ncbi:MAG: hypothetical protein HZA46_16620 [Planctomycetales bacterium]|nr:hypothetical protein [Planctomycetales bacterium]
MSTGFALVLLWSGLCQSPDVTSPSDQSPVANDSATEISATEAPPRTAKKLREAVRDALRDSARACQPDYEEVAPRLLDLFRELDSSAELPRAERRSLRSSLRTRLLQIEDVLARRLLRAEGEAKSKRSGQASGQSSKPGTSEPANLKRPAAVAPPTVVTLAQRGAAGGGQPGGTNTGGQTGVINRGWDLVALIRNTVAPDTWDVNGGNGSIYFYRPLNVIVVRQTQAVHDELGEVLGQIRRQQ